MQPSPWHPGQRSLPLAKRQVAGHDEYPVQEGQLTANGARIDHSPSHGNLGQAGIPDVLVVISVTGLPAPTIGDRCHLLVPIHDAAQDIHFHRVALMRAGYVPQVPVHHVPQGRNSRGRAGFRRRV